MAMATVFDVTVDLSVAVNEPYTVAGVPLNPSLMVTTLVVVAGKLLGTK